MARKAMEPNLGNGAVNGMDKLLRVERFCHELELSRRDKTRVSKLSPQREQTLAAATFQLKVGIFGETIRPQAKGVIFDQREQPQHAV